jgi:hypothetical protein
VDAWVQRVGDQVACKYFAVFANANAGGGVHEDRLRPACALGAGVNWEYGRWYRPFCSIAKPRRFHPRV